MYSQLIKEILLELPRDGNNKTEFADFCRNFCAKSSTECQKIDKFEQEYDRPSPIWWYTKEPFIYSTLNQALRIQDTDTILKMGFIVRDIHCQIEELHNEANNYNRFTVYRGQGMPHAEFQKLKSSTGGLLSFNNFLSTSMNYLVSLEFADSQLANHDITGIVFAIDIDPVISSSPFATLDKCLSSHEEEEEILFSMHTIFRIGDMEEIKDRFWYVNFDFDE